MVHIEKASKKTKRMNNLTIAKMTLIADLREQWLIKCHKNTLALKTKIKKLKAAKDNKKAKIKVKQDKNCEIS